MNNIYVDKLRKTCKGCFCRDCDSWCSLLKRYMDYKDERKRPKDCPLKPLTDRLAEEFEALKETFVWGRDNGYLTPKSAVGIVENKIKDLRGK